MMRFFAGRAATRPASFEEQRRDSMNMRIHQRVIGTFAALLFAGLANVANAASIGGEPLDAAIGKIADVARKEKLQTLLILIREDSRSDIDAELPTILQALRDELQSALAAERLTGVRSNNVEQRPGASKAFAPLRPADVGVFKRGEKFDAVVTVDYRKQGRSRTLRVSLVDDKAQLLTRTFSLAGDTATTAKKSLVARSNTATTGTGVSTRSTGTTVSRGMSRAAAAGLAGILARGVNGSAYTQTAGATGGSIAGGSQTAGTTSTNSSGTGTSTKAGNSTTASDGSISRLNENILTFALSHLGEQVGNGECWTLAAEALKAAGAEPPRGYKFGDPVNLNQIVPGDILQFTSAVFEEPGIIKYFGFPNHTAIVYKVEGSRIYVLHQHVGDSKTVMIGDVDLSTKTSGEVEAYRARPRNSESAQENGQTAAAKSKAKCEKPEGAVRASSSSP